ncbi:hypothetical protein DRP04_13770, partial [Archaeoglobales archaeon]
MRGLALNTVFALLIAIAAAAIFLSLVTGTFKRASDWIYCKVYVGIANFFSRGEFTLPVICKEMFGGRVERVEITEREKEIVARELLSYIIACWKKTELTEAYYTHTCYEIRLPGNVEDVSEKDVSRILLEEDKCKSIQNWDYGCGAKDQIIWSVEGKVNLTAEQLSKAINEVTTPNEIPVESYM